MHFLFFIIVELRQIFWEKQTNIYQTILWYLFFAFNGIFLLFGGNVIFEILALLGTFGTALSVVYYVVLEQMATLLQLKSQKGKPTLSKKGCHLLSERSFTTFRWYSAKCIMHLKDFNRLYGTALALFFLFCYPCNAAIIVLLIFHPADSIILSATASLLAFYQLFFMFFMHAFSARMTAKLHRPAKLLIGAEFANEGDDAEKQKFNRASLTLSNYIFYFHTYHQYAMTYGKAGNVTFRSFLRVSNFEM